MVLIEERDGTVTCTGHASTREACAMLSALTESLRENITERLEEDAAFVLEPGRFQFCRNGLSHDAAVLVDSFLYSMGELATFRPQDFKIV